VGSLARDPKVLVGSGPPTSVPSLNVVSRTHKDQVDRQDPRILPHHRWRRSARNDHPLLPRVAQIAQIQLEELRQDRRQGEVHEKAM
jgi:hypothetical protein